MQEITPTLAILFYCNVEMVLECMEFSNSKLSVFIVKPSEGIIYFFIFIDMERVTHHIKLSSI